MEVATWNVNGIRARASQLREWLECERPDVVCLQELKAELSQIPDECRLTDFHEYWHYLIGGRAARRAAGRARRDWPNSNSDRAHPPRPCPAA